MRIKQLQTAVSAQVLESVPPEHGRLTVQINPLLKDMSAVCIRVHSQLQDYLLLTVKLSIPQGITGIWEASSQDATPLDQQISTLFY